MILFDPPTAQFHSLRREEEDVQKSVTTWNCYVPKPLNKRRSRRLVVPYKIELPRSIAIEEKKNKVSDMNTLVDSL